VLGIGVLRGRGEPHEIAEQDRDDPALLQGLESLERNAAGGAEPRLIGDGVSAWTGGEQAGRRLGSSGIVLVRHVGPPGPGATGTPARNSPRPPSRRYARSRIGRPALSL